MNSFFLEEYARQRHAEIAQEFDRIHAAGMVRRRRNPRQPLLNRIGKILTGIGNQLQEKYAVPEVSHE